MVHPGSIAVAYDYKLSCSKLLAVKKKFTMIFSSPRLGNVPLKHGPLKAFSNCSGIRYPTSLTCQSKMILGLKMSPQTRVCSPYVGIMKLCQEGLLCTKLHLGRALRNVELLSGPQRLDVIYWEL